MDTRITPVGDQALIVAFESRVDPVINATAVAAAKAIEAAALPGVHDVAPALCTVGVHYDPIAVAQAAAESAGAVRSPAGGRGTGTEGRARAAGWQAPHAWLAERIRRVLANLPPATVGGGREVEIPVVYGGEHGPDLDEVASRCGLSTEAVIERHLASPHQVFMLGFTPGLPFIGGLDAALALPRRATPRTRVPARTVAIAREQTVIYSYETPGGWNLIGSTPLDLFDAGVEPPCRLLPGDRVRFRRITLAEYETMRKAAAAGRLGWARS